MNVSVEALIPLVLNTALEAGKAILNVYESGWEITAKADNSPLTTADLVAHEVISKALHKTGIPVLSEEGNGIPYEIRKEWSQCWIVDPLDGTKEFISRNGEFTVNIGLVLNHEPVLGVIFIPVTGMLYFGCKGAGSFRVSAASLSGINLSECTFSDVAALSEKLPLSIGRDEFVVMGSRSHLTAGTVDIIERAGRLFPGSVVISAGSSMKFCRLAEGSADFYPRFGPTMEWDTCAGQAIAVNAGMTVVSLPEMAPITYNREELRNPFFAVYNPSRIDLPELLRDKK